MHALIIDTSTERGMLAIWRDGQVTYVKQLPFGYQQSKALIPELESALQQQAFHPSELDCIGIGIGPGSYTGIRVGAAVAKGLAYSWQIPLIGFSTLEGFVPEEKQVSFAAVIDAKIGGAYLLTGRKGAAEVHYTGDPSVYPLEELRERLKEASILVTPYARLLQEKCEALNLNDWKWEEAPLNPFYIGVTLEKKYQKGEWALDRDVSLLYLRQTEAERERQARQTGRE